MDGNINYSANTIAKYVINYFNESKIPISNLKLQCILYYLQSAFLVEADAPLFNENFERWAYPVIPEIYRIYSMFGMSNIRLSMLCDNKVDVIEDSTCSLIKKIIDSKEIYNSLQLVTMSRCSEPYCSTEVKNIISKISIKKWFDSNKNKIYE